MLSVSPRTGPPASPVEWESDGRALPIVAVAVHAGHRLRAEVRELTALSDKQRLREEDPGTDVLARAAPLRGIALRSRFEVDLNRVRDEAVYVDPEDAWGFDLWKERPDEGSVARSLALYDQFYRQFASKIEETILAHGAAVVLDLHSYNHMRDGKAEDPSGAPEVNIGTGSLDAGRWGHVVKGFMSDLAEVGLDARENVRFQGRQVAGFVHSMYPETACALAVEFKKTYMDEASGAIDRSALAALARALSTTFPGLLERLSSAKVS